MVKAKSVADTLGPGEAAEAKGRRSMIRLIGLSAGLGGVTGATVVLLTAQGGDLLSRPLPIWAAAVLSAALLGLWGYAAWFSETHLDEVERAANYWGYAVGGGVLFALYPVWYLFWWAEAVPEPSHEVLMAVLLTTALAGYLWKKFR